MAYPAYIRDKARQLRQEKKLTIDELAERLALPRTTIYYWVRDLPIERDPDKSRAAALKGTRMMQRKYRLIREEAYERGRAEFPELAADPCFRDFVCMYIGEGYKRSRNVVSIGNSDPAVVKLADQWIRRFSNGRVSYQFQYHADQDPLALRRFWAQELDADEAQFVFQRKSNSSQLSGRIWRCKYGVLSVRASDTALRARLQGWIDSLKEQWLDSNLSGA